MNPPDRRLQVAAAGDSAAEQALRTQWEDLRMILDSVPAFIWYKDCDNRVLRVNRPAALSLGKTVGEIEGRSTYELYPEEATKYHEDDLEVIRSGQPKLGIVEMLATASGEKRWVRTDKVPHRDATGTVVGVIVFAVDITERVSAEDALRDARDGLEQRVAERTRQLADAVADLRAEMAEHQRTEARLAAHQSQLAHLQRLRTVEGMATQLAHELNQPLGAIANFAGGLLRRANGATLDAAVVRTAAEQISQQALRAGAAVRRVREFVRKEERHADLCRLSDLIADGVHLVQLDAQRHRVDIIVTCDPALPDVEVNRIQIEQVVVNLLTNAIESIRGSGVHAGQIVITASLRADGHAEVRVVDSGTGLPVANGERLFEPFFTTKHDGLGMGLTISESIVVAHGGTIRAEPVSGGAAFVFTLPCSPLDATTAHS